MQRIPFPSNAVDPRRKNNFLDACAFDPKYGAEEQAAKTILTLHKEGKIHLLITHSNQKEIDLCNTPEDVKREATGMNFTIETPLNQVEIDRKKRIHAYLTGTGKSENYTADSAHIFEAGRWGGGFFITVDKRILQKRDELQNLSGSTICLPSEWLKYFNDTENV